VRQAGQKGQGRAMTLDEFDAFCQSLAHSTRVVQWGDAHVWKIGGKMFAIGFPSNAPLLQITFKSSAMSFDLLKDQPGMRSAPYLASRGMLWLQRTDPTTLDDAALRDYLKASYKLVASGLPKKTRQALGFAS
jgi:predicted DNA-binding protein (MmcQ/YjbR family)